MSVPAMVDDSAMDSGAGVRTHYTCTGCGGVYPRWMSHRCHAVDHSEERIREIVREEIARMAVRDVPLAGTGAVNLSSPFAE